MIPLSEKGLTLIELLITVVILAVVANTSVASFQWLSERTAASTTRNNIDRAFALARITAITEHTIVTICPLDSANKCTNDWSLPTAVFRDPSGSLTLSTERQLVKLLPLAASGKLTPSNSFHGPRRYFQYRKDGSIRGTLGNFTWCPRSGNRQSAIHVRVNFGGRLVWSRDSNGNQIVEDSGGSDISC